MLLKKEAAILLALLKDADKYNSSQMIASELETSDRTARKYLQSLSDKLVGSGAKIEAKVG